jgi:hypothetical protein
VDSRPFSRHNIAIDGSTAGKSFFLPPVGWLLQDQN